MTCTKVTIYAAPDNLLLAARVAMRVLSPGYEWPSDGVSLSQFVGGPEDALISTFSAKLNKAGITIWEQTSLPAYSTCPKSAA